MARHRLSDYPYQYHSTPLPSHLHKHQQPNLKPETPILSEWKLAILGLIVSLFVISAKLTFAYQDDIRQFVVDRQLFMTEIVKEDGRVMYLHTWKNVVKYSNLWLPIICGAITTYFTWVMVYLDSHTPGIQPPSPLSPNRYKARSGHVFHLNYVFAVLMGVLVAAYMYWRKISIEY